MKKHKKSNLIFKSCKNFKAKNCDFFWYFLGIIVPTSDHIFIKICYENYTQWESGIRTLIVYESPDSAFPLCFKFKFEVSIILPPVGEPFCLISYSFLKDNYKKLGIFYYFREIQFNDQFNDIFDFSKSPFWQASFYFQMSINGSPMKWSFFGIV